MRTRDDYRLIDVALDLITESRNGLNVLVTDGTMAQDGKTELKIWLPKSQIEINDDGTITMPEWLALKKGLI